MCTNIMVKGIHGLHICVADFCHLHSFSVRLMLDLLRNSPEVSRMSLAVKQGLALINGTQMISSLGSEAVERALAVARQADIIAALTLEALQGTKKAYHSGTQRTICID